MFAHIKWREDMVFDATDDVQSLVMDSERVKGHSPMRLVLMALGGCASIDVVEIIKKRRREIVTLEIDVKGERRDLPHPRIFEKIHVHFKLTSPDANDRELERAISLSVQSYCSVAGMMQATVEITTSFEIVRP